MKPLRTVLFIFAVLSLLSFLCICWPSHEVSIMGHVLHWPTWSEAIGTGRHSENTKDLRMLKEIPDTLAVLPPEELIEQEMHAAHGARQQDFIEFSNKSHLRLHLPPSDSIAYFDNFFASLEQAQTCPLRILHYGDSQIEEDRISACLRDHLQKQFGGHGVGLLPAQPLLAKMTVKQNTEPSLPYFLAYGPKSMRASDNRYGPMLQMSPVSGQVSISLEPSPYSRFDASKSFDRVGVLVEGSGCIECQTPDSIYTLIESDSAITPQYLTLDLPELIQQTTLQLSGQWNVYGITLDGQRGISLDNMAMRGYDGITFNTIAEETLRPFFDVQHIALIMLQYGGNSVPYLTSQEAIDHWKRNIGLQIDFFHRLAPEACILMIGPADMSTTIEGELQTYPMLPKIVQALREAANEHNAAFWSMYDAMGGWNSMLRWVEARPQLAGEDYIHFTHKGANKMADLLDEVIVAYYRDYRLRHGLDEDIETDSEIPFEKETQSYDNEQYNE